MNKIIPYVKAQLKYFFINPFWRQISVVVILIISLLINGSVWFLYLTKMRIFGNITQIGFSSAVLILDLILAGISFPRQQLVSYILISAGLLVQIIFITFLISLSTLPGV